MATQLLCKEASLLRGSQVRILPAALCWSSRPGGLRPRNVSAEPSCVPIPEIGVRSARERAACPPTGHIFRVERAHGPVWHAKDRVPDGRQSRRRSGRRRVIAATRRRAGSQSAPRRRGCATSSSRSATTLGWSEQRPCRIRAMVEGRGAGLVLERDDRHALEVCHVCGTDRWVDRDRAWVVSDGGLGWGLIASARV